MARIIGGVGTTHVPAIGSAIAKGLQNDPYWKPFFDGFHHIHKWGPRRTEWVRSGLLSGRRAA